MDGDSIPFYSTLTNKGKFGNPSFDDHSLREGLIEFFSMKLHESKKMGLTSRLYGN